VERVSANFRDWNPEQIWLLPPSVMDFVAPGHVAHFVRDLIREQIDMSTILRSYKQERGFPPFHPTMMTALLLYAYTQGIYSSRKIAQACEQRLDFMAVTGNQRPDFRTINTFRLRHLPQLGGLFVVILQLCQKAGLCSLGHVALDGTKLKANASKHKAMSYGRLKQKIPQVAQEVASWFHASNREDAADDTSYGKDKRGDELPEWIKSKQVRLAKMQQAKAAIDAGLTASENDEDPDPKTPSGGKKKRRLSQAKEDKLQKNFTDPDSRIMVSGGTNFIQGFNGQAAVDADNQIIVACDLSNAASDNKQLLPMLALIEANMGRAPREISADKGYASEANLEALEAKGQRAYIATGRQKHNQAYATFGQPSNKPLTKKMATRLRRGGWRSRYRLRKITVEPIFGQMKSARGFRQVSFRGIEKVRAEWAMICAASNLLKLAKAKQAA
jgi:transposase